MTKQVLLAQTRVDVTGCVRCQHLERSDLFDTCRHQQAQYGDGELHTIQHMRGEFGKCGPDRRLRAEK